MMKFFFRAAAVGSLVLLPGCWYLKPSEEDCTKAHLNNVRLLAEDETFPEEMKRMMLRTIVDPEKQRAMIQSCMEKKTRGQIRCELAAPTFQELRKCSPGRAEQEKESK